MTIILPFDIERYTPKFEILVQILTFFGLKVYNIVLGYLIDHIKPNTIQFEGFHIIMECPPNGPLYLATGEEKVDFEKIRSENS